MVSGVESAEREGVCGEEEGVCEEQKAKICLLE